MSLSFFPYVVVLTSESSTQQIQPYLIVRNKLQNTTQCLQEITFLNESYVPITFQINSWNGIYSVRYKDILYLFSCYECLFRSFRISTDYKRPTFPLTSHSGTGIRSSSMNAKFIIIALCAAQVSRILLLQMLPAAKLSTSSTKSLLLKLIYILNKTAVQGRHYTILINITQKYICLHTLMKMQFG